MHLEHLRVDFNRIAQSMNQLAIRRTAAQKDPNPHSTQASDPVDQLLGLALAEIRHVIDCNQGVRLVLKLIGNDLELHKHLAPNSTVCLDDPHGTSRRIAFNLLGILQQHRGFPKAIRRVEDYDAGLSALGDKFVHQAIAPHRITTAQRHKLEVVRIAQIVNHARSSTRPHGHRNARPYVSLDE